MKKKHIKKVLFAKTMLNSTKILISRCLINTYISHDEFISVNNALKHDTMMIERSNKKI